MGKKQTEVHLCIRERSEPEEASGQRSKDGGQPP